MNHPNIHDRIAFEGRKASIWENEAIGQGSLLLREAH